MAKEYKTKECEGECPKCGGYDYDVVDWEQDNDDTETVYCACNDCQLRFSQFYCRAYCGTEWEQDVDLNSKTLFDKY